MAYRKKEDTGREFKVSRVRETRLGLMFDLETSGIHIYGCRYCEGKNGDFVGFPSYKGKDGRYYNNAWIDLTESESKAILEAVVKEVENN